MRFISNPQLDLAFDYVRNTNKHIFLTGKAGTGKTTFLHRVKEEGLKRLVVTAPTGVAAINAGGVTLHSFFQLPFGLHLPGVSREAHDQRRMSGEKVRLIRSLDLLVIDEISMVRADLLDAVDDVLRRFRDYSRPFGGVQLLMIGDLHQLPPVVKQEDWELLRPHYQTPYFFGSLALQRTDMVAIELSHIFRQTDRSFIDLLNRVRDSEIDAGVVATLNSRYIASFTPGEDEGYITLTSHNALANNINSARLEALAERPQSFKAKIEGEFPESAYPTESVLSFKKGAQVMFVKNDPSEEKRFFNGKIGRITRFGGEQIFVRCKGEPGEIAVSPLEWQNIRYLLDEESKEIREERLGAFTQYPLKLAWAITIHKSQGLTFDRAIIDARAAFAHGQVYVALSRCRTFEGIVLSSRLDAFSVKTDEAVRDYSRESRRNVPDETRLLHAKREYQEELLGELFDFRAMNRHLNQLNRLFREHADALSPDGLVNFKALVANAAAEIFSVTEKFLPQLRTYFSQPELPEQNEALRHRLQKASAYFLPKLEKEILPVVRNIRLVTDDKAVRKTFGAHVQNLEKEIIEKRACFLACADGFSAVRYARAKTNAEVDFLSERRRAATAAPAASGAPKDMPHPELYARLLRWRRETAEKHGIDARQVLRTRSLEDLVRVLPVNIASLRGIERLGNVRIKRFGAGLIGVISAYCAERNIQPKKSDESESPEPAVKIDTKRQSFDLFKSGKSIEAIAAERGLKPGTIEAHLAHFIALGELEISNFLSEDQVKEISGFFNEKETQSTAEAKAHFGDEYSYGELSMVLAHMKRPAG